VENANSSQNPARRLYISIETYPAAALEELLEIVSTEKRTGSLTVNFAGGKMSGTIEFKQAIRPKEGSEHHNGTGTPGLLHG